MPFVPQVAHGRGTMRLDEYLLKMTKDQNVSKFRNIANYIKSF